MEISKWKNAARTLKLVENDQNIKAKKKAFQNTI